MAGFGSGDGVGGGRGIGRRRADAGYALPRYALLSALGRRHAKLLDGAVRGAGSRTRGKPERGQGAGPHFPAGDGTAGDRGGTVGGKPKDGTDAGAAIYDSGVPTQRRSADLDLRCDCHVSVPLGACREPHTERILPNESQTVCNRRCFPVFTVRAGHDGRGVLQVRSAVLPGKLLRRELLPGTGIVLPRRLLQPQIIP